MTITKRRMRIYPLALSALPAALLIGCGGGSSDAGLPQLAAANPGSLKSCSDLAARINFPNTTITAASPVAAGTLTVAGTPVAAHCQITGTMHSRVSAVDGKNYAIGFEMRLPNAWNGRFYYQANGGLDGSVVPATGSYSSGVQVTSALLQGFAVISSDAGHTGAQNNTFGFDPQARLDYGYQAPQKLTPMAKNAIELAYGRAPDRSYFGGCSNGGRHTMVAMSRLANEYDGFLAGDPGFNLPKAAVSQVWGAKKYAALATPGAMTTAPAWLGGFPVPDIGTAFTPAERTLVSNRILAKCDALDGVTDGIVGDVAACQTQFKLNDDVPTCTGARDGSCLTAEQNTMVAEIHTGAKTSAGAAIYSTFPLDPGIANQDWATWEFVIGQVLDPLSSGTVFSTPPVQQTLATANIDQLAASIFATNATFTESSMSFMTPPNPTDLAKLKGRGAKVMVFHGTGDAVFSYDDTVNWYKGVAAANQGDASNFARLFPVPAMGHCGSGITTDQFDMLTPLVNWVEKGQAPDKVIAQARGAGNAAGANLELPASWSANRTRPLCAYPKVARYNGTGDIESASSFSCK
ncbi:feruloyl esterase [Acidovorax sp. 93]|uniref:tannase/feruloyl esterase family alpha/beta hydrolase n=1 Tax=Acidovorax sp. 93 TaxID=2135632 RepID=UPI000F2A5918|nr:tannase/feruloyl esterase family alpha/beta hydrolase [Acidovorax sp. 93]RKR28499.1 feruloyl esterase [Acidovorax sp. 93]